MVIEHKEPEGWHIRKEIQLGHLLTTLTIVVSVILYISVLERRISLIELTVLNQKETDTRQDRQMENQVQMIQRSLEKLDTKLDKNLYLWHFYVAADTKKPSIKEP